MHCLKCDGQQETCWSEREGGLLRSRRNVCGSWEITLCSNQSLCITRGHLVVPSHTVFSPAPICSGGFGDSRPNQFDLAALGFLYRKKVSDVILGLFDMLLWVSIREIAKYLGFFWKKAHRFYSYLIYHIHTRKDKYSVKTLTSEENFMDPKDVLPWIGCSQVPWIHYKKWDSGCFLLLLFCFVVVFFLFLFLFFFAFSMAFFLIVIISQIYSITFY